MSEDRSQYNRRGDKFASWSHQELDGIKVHCRLTLFSWTMGSWLAYGLREGKRRSKVALRKNGIRQQGLPRIFH